MRKVDWKGSLRIHTITLLAGTQRPVVQVYAANAHYEGDVDTCCGHEDLLVRPHMMITECEANEPTRIAVCG